MQVRLIVNRGGGSSGDDVGERLRAAFAAHGIAPVIVDVAPEDLPRVCGEAASA